MPGDTGNQITAWSIFSLLVGTIVSSIVAYLLQRNSFAEARRQKAQDKFEELKALGLTLFHKMKLMSSTLETLKGRLMAHLPDAKEIGDHPWQHLPPLANFPDRVKFTADELTFLMLLDMNLFDSMVRFDEIHNNIIDLFELYRTKRSSLTDTLAAEMTEKVGTVNLDKSEMMKVGPRMAELNSLIETMIKTTREESKKAREYLVRLCNSLNQKFNLTLN